MGHCPKPSPASGDRYGIARVCRVWAVPRSSFYAARKPGTGSTAKLVRRGPPPAVSGDALLAAIKNDIECSPWTGEGHRKVLCGRPHEANPIFSSSQRQAAQAGQPRPGWSHHSAAPNRTGRDDMGTAAYRLDNGVIERLFRTLKEQVVHGRIFQTIDEVRNAVRAFAVRYNAEWLIEKNGQRSPDAMRAAWQEQTFKRAA